MLSLSRKFEVAAVARNCLAHDTANCINHMIRYQLLILTYLGPVIAGLSVWVEANAAGGELASTACGASALLRDEDTGVGDKED